MAKSRKSKRQAPNAHASFAESAAEDSASRMDGSQPRRNVTVLVLGDIGRSPRMQNHAVSLAHNGFNVDLVGYDGAEPFDAVKEAEGLRLVHISQLWRPPPGSSRALFLAWAPLKIILQIFQLLWALLFCVRRPEFIFVQNPPAIPSLAIARLVAWFYRAKLIIDWHNYGYTILALSVGAKSLAVRAAYWYERTFGRDAYAHLCVTKAMADELKQVWKIHGKVVTFYDRAQVDFHRLDLAEAHKFLSAFKVDLDLIHPRDASNPYWFTMASPPPNTTLLTAKANKKDAPASRLDRPVLIVSGTSWTADEDFGMLLEALRDYDRRVQTSLAADSPTKLLPRLVMIITGKGPLRESYENKIRQLRMQHVRILTKWLAAEDYPRLLGCADLGISLHASSSGLDLPMKVVDMFGCGLPVLAYGYETVKELVAPGKSGLLFNAAPELADNLVYMLEGYPKQQGRIQRMREGVQDAHRKRWPENWNAVVRPLLK